MIKVLSIILIFLLAILPVAAFNHKEGLAFYLIKGNKETNKAALDSLPIGETLFTQKEIILTQYLISR